MKINLMKFVKFTIGHNSIGIRIYQLIFDYNIITLS